MTRSFSCVCIKYYTFPTLSLESPTAASVTTVAHHITCTVQQHIVWLWHNYCYYYNPLFYLNYYFFSLTIILFLIFIPIAHHSRRQSLSRTFIFKRSTKPPHSSQKILTINCCTNHIPEDMHRDGLIHK